MIVENKQDTKHKVGVVTKKSIMKLLIKAKASEVTKIDDKASAVAKKLNKAGITHKDDAGAKKANLAMVKKSIKTKVVTKNKPDIKLNDGAANIAKVITYKSGIKSNNDEITNNITMTKSKGISIPKPKAATLGKPKSRQSQPLEILSARQVMDIITPRKLFIQNSSKREV